MPLINDQGTGDDEEDAADQGDDGIQALLDNAIDDVSFDKNPSNQLNK